MSLPTHKRKRTLSQSSNTSPNLTTFENKTLTRSENIYLDDGNIILIAEDIAFRVHRSQLARHSEVFRDMLALTTQPDDAEAFDGCAVVRLSDKSEDVLGLLRTLYDNTQFRPNAARCLTGVLRLSTKYLIDPIRTSALDALRQAYPTTLEQWDAYRFNRNQVGSVVRLAYEINAHILLPAAYYALCDYGIDYVLSLDLPPHILATYCRGKDKIATRLATFVEHEIVEREVGEECDQIVTCREALQFLEADAHRILRDHRYIIGPNPLYGLKEFLEFDCVLDACRECQDALKEVIQEERERIWVSLPQIFGLGSWDDLQKRK